MGERQQCRDRRLEIDVASRVQQRIGEASVRLCAALNDEPVPAVARLVEPELEDDRPDRTVRAIHPLCQPAEHDVRVAFDHRRIVRQPRLRPGAQRTEWCHQAEADVGQTVGRVRTFAAGHHPEHLQPAQPVGKHRTRDPAGQAGGEVVESLRP